MSLGILFLLLAVRNASADEATNSFQLSIHPQGNSAVLQWPSGSGSSFQLEHRATLGVSWQPVVTNLPAASNAITEFIHSNALLSPAGFYRVGFASNPVSPPTFTFDWTGTNFVYTDSQRSFTGVMLKPAGNGPFPAVLIQHGAGGSAIGYSLPKAQEMMPWGLVCIAPNLTHVQGETNPTNMGFCPENLARATACFNVLASLPYVDTNRLAIFGHSMGAYATIGDAAVLVDRIRAGSVSAGGVNPNASGTNAAGPTVGEANGVRAPFLMIHCDGDTTVFPSASLLFQQVLNSNAVPNLRILISSNSIPNPTNWHNIHRDPGANEIILTNTRAWFQTHGVLP